MHTDDACALLLEACDVLERRHLDGAALDEVDALHAALVDAGSCDDPTVAGDVGAVLVELEALRAALEARPTTRPHARAA